MYVHFERKTNPKSKSAGVRQLKTRREQKGATKILLSFLLWHWPIGTRRFQRQSVCTVCLSLEPNPPLVTTGLTGFPESAKKTFSFPLQHLWLPPFSVGEEFVTDDYLSDSVIRHYSTQKPFLIQIFKIHFSHTDRTLAHLSHTEWFLLPQRGSVQEGGAGVKGFMWALTPQGQSPANHPWSQTECQHATAARLIFFPRMPPSVVCFLLLSVASRYIFHSVRWYC